MILVAVLVPWGNRNRDSPRRSTHPHGPNSIDRCHTESKSSHPGTYPLNSVDTCGTRHLAANYFGARGTAKTKAAGGGVTSATPPLLRRRNRAEYMRVAPPCKNFCHPTVNFF